MLRLTYRDEDSEMVDASPRRMTFNPSTCAFVPAAPEPPMGPDEWDPPAPVMGFYSLHNQRPAPSCTSRKHPRPEDDAIGLVPLSKRLVICPQRVPLAEWSAAHSRPTTPASPSTLSSMTNHGEMI